MYSYVVVDIMMGNTELVGFLGTAVSDPGDVFLQMFRAE